MHMYLCIVTDRVDMAAVGAMEEVVDMTEVMEGVDMVEGVVMAVEGDPPSPYYRRRSPSPYYRSRRYSRSRSRSYSPSEFC